MLPCLAVLGGTRQCLAMLNRAWIVELKHNSAQHSYEVCEVGGEGLALHEVTPGQSFAYHIKTFDCVNGRVSPVGQ